MEQVNIYLYEREDFIMNSKRWTAVGIALVVLFFSIISQVANYFMTAPDADGTGFADLLGRGNLSTQVIEQGDFTRRIAVLQVNGAIIDNAGASVFDTQTFRFREFMDMIDAIENDNTVAGVILAVNSPGGGIYESAQIRLGLERLQKERDLPIYVSFGAVAASGGYYISAGADKIFAPRETLTGSIGVIFSSLNFAGLFEEHGISDMTITSGEHKDIFSPFREMTHAERAIIQSMVDNAQDAFVSIIAEGRGMSEEEVRAIADGRIYDGLQAKEIGLIDEFGYLGDVIDAMRTDLGLPNAQVFTYEVAPAFPSLWGFNLSYILGRESSVATQMARALDTNSMPRLMYIAPAMVK